MKSTKKAAYFVLFASMTLGSVTPIHAQQRRASLPMPTYAPPQAPVPPAPGSCSDSSPTY